MVVAQRCRRATWVWTIDTPDDVLAFAVERRLDELFVHVPVGCDTDPTFPDVVRLADGAHRRGMRVSALGGDPGWLDDPGAVVNTWLTPALGTGLFDGVHLDVEPDIPDGASARPVVDRFVALIRTLADSTPNDVALEADVRFWYPEVSAGARDLTSTLMSIVDAVTVLSYRTSTSGVDGSVALTRPTQRIAAVAGRRFRVGQETLPLGSHPDQRKQTFHGRPRAELEAAMEIIDDAFGEQPGYAGTAVHDWRGYRSLPGPLSLGATTSAHPS